jgi:single-strand DNA-binding protein
MVTFSGHVRNCWHHQKGFRGTDLRKRVQQTRVRAHDRFGRFPQDIKFECVKDKVALVAALKPGDKVKVSFDLRGREWKENYYVNLNAWKITPDGAAGAPPAADDGAPLPEEPGETAEDVPF